MSEFIATYDPKKVIIQVDGEEVYGFAEGTMVSVERNEELFNNQIGTKGEVARAVNRNKTALITVTLQHVSPFVAKIKEWAAQDIAPVITFGVIDPASYDDLLVAQCWLQKDSTHEWGNEVGNREYQFFAVNLQDDLGTGADPSLNVLGAARGV